MKLALVLLLPLVFGLELSEIYVNPVGSDNGKEFIELVGNENLSGCVVSDSKSSDVLELVQLGSDVILIVEEDGVYGNSSATLYSAGKAIGNGLGNSADDIAVTCSDVLINASYVVADVEGYDKGYSLLWSDGWSVGTEGGTPGVVDEEVVEPIIEIEETRPRKKVFCNTTLVITVSNTTVRVGDTVLFTIVADDIARFEVKTDTDVVLEGDTLTLDSYGVIAPNATELELVAYAEQCDAKQRAKRFVTVLPPIIHIENETEEIVNETVEQTVVEVTTQTPSYTVPESEPLEITGRVVYDQDKNVVPWVSAFGIVVILVSAGLFLVVRKKELL